MQAFHFCLMAMLTLRQRETCGMRVSRTAFVTAGTRHSQVGRIGKLLRLIGMAQGTVERLLGRSSATQQDHTECHSQNAHASPQQTFYQNLYSRERANPEQRNY
jgi:hypothetical protein